MSLYSYTTAKEGKLYGVRFRVSENGILVHKNLRGFKTQKAAKIAEFEYRKRAEKEIELSKQPEKTVYTLNDIWERYFKWAVDNLSPSSIYSYRNIYTNCIQPIFGSKDIRSITKKQITIWQDDLPSSYSYSYKQSIRATFSAIMTYAVNRDYIEKNNVTSTERIRKTEPKKKLSYWTKEEFDQFIEVVDNPTYKAFFTFLYVSGCRKGEAFALRWSDIDFNRSTVSITKSITKKGMIMTTEYGKDIIEKTKNKKWGDLYMPQSTMDLISSLPRGEYVFGGDKPLSETSVARDFNRYIELAGVKRIRVHDLRHSCAALMISSAPNAEIAVLYTVADRLRDSVDQVLKTYGHLFPSRNAEIINHFNTLF